MLYISQPHPWARQLDPGDGLVDYCTAKCGHPKPVEGNCSSDRWTPNYETQGNCECLTEYKCCEPECKIPTVEQCWGKDHANKGTV